VRLDGKPPSPRVQNHIAKTVDPITLMKGFESGLNLLTRHLQQAEPRQMAPLRLIVWSSKTHNHWFNYLTRGLVTAVVGLCNLKVTRNT
jgi:hypothetical protein